MDKDQILTDEELPMLRDLGDAGDKAVDQFLRGYLNLPLQSLLQRADPLVLEARLAGHQLRFPLSCTDAAEGHAELGYPRAWRLDETSTLRTADALYIVHGLSVDGLIVEG